MRAHRRTLRPEHNHWEALPSMDHRRAWAAAVSLGGRLYLAGGDGGDISLASAKRFAPQRNLWESLTSDEL